MRRLTKKNAFPLSECVSVCLEGAILHALNSKTTHSLSAHFSLPFMGCEVN